MNQKLRVQNQPFEIFSKTVYFLDSPKASCAQKAIELAILPPKGGFYPK
jgi:hypothetical protein